MTTKLKPRQKENLINDSIQTSMAGSMGIAVVKLRKAVADTGGADSIKLNDELIQIWKQARKQMRAAIESYLQTQGE